MGRGAGSAEQTTLPQLRSAAATSGYERFCRDRLDLTLIQNDAQLAAALAELRALAPAELALDVETTLDETVGRRDQARGSLRLVQLGIEEPERGIAPRQWVIDCHRCDTTPLVELFADASLVKLIHNAAFEAEWIASRYGVELAGVFDTMVAWRRIQAKLDSLDESARAAAGFPGLVRKLKARSEWCFFGNTLADLAERQLGIKLPKAEQAGDWGRSTLAGSQLVYAALDVALLPALARPTRQLLDRLGLVEEVEQKTRQSLAAVAARVNDPELLVQDDSARVARLLQMAQSRAELEQVWRYSRQMAILARNRPSLRALFEQRQAELAETLLAA
jgi:ribonuclease D